MEVGPGADDDSFSGSDTAQLLQPPLPGPVHRARPTKEKEKEAFEGRACNLRDQGRLCAAGCRRSGHCKSQGGHGEDSAAADEETVRELLKQLKLKDVAEGKAGFGGKNGKDTGDHKVCCLCNKCNR